MRLALLGVLAPSLLLATATRAQAVRVTRRMAVDSALRRSPRLPAARAAVAAARAEALGARALPNPTINGEYTRSAPQLHALLDVPFDLPGVRGARRGAAAAALQAAGYRFRWDSAAVALDADTAYTMALAAMARARLSRRNADDADSLRRMAAARAQAGDAAEMDVLLATVVSGQATNLASGDSLEAIARVLDLQAVMGLPADAPRLELADSLSLADSVSLVPGGGAAVARRDADSVPGGAAGTAPRAPNTLPIAAAAAEVIAAEQRLRLQRRSVLGQPSVTVGAEWRDPAGDERGLLPIVGLALPLPLFNRNRGAIAAAQAERARTVAELAVARISAQSELAHLVRARDGALVRASRGRLLLADAERVAAMALTAYREGASSLPAVLEARRTVREVAAQYVDDVAAALVAAAQARLLTLAPDTP